MNETIGEKGGHNDQIRTNKIKKRKKEKEEKDEELEKLEEEVKKQQKYTLLHTIPLVLVAGTIKVLYDISTGKKKVDKQEVNSQWRIKEYDTDVTTVSTQEQELKKQYEKHRKKHSIEANPITIEVATEDDVKNKTNYTPTSNNIDYDKKIFPKRLDQVEPKTKEEKATQEITFDISNPRKIETLTTTNKEKQFETINRGVGIDSSIENITSSILPDYYFSSPINSNELNEKTAKILENLKTRKIVDEYERKLKDIRFELRQTIYDYNALVDDSEEAILSEETEIILDKLTEIIAKVEELKRKIEIEDIDKYDDNYIYTLIEGYLHEFKDKKFVSEIKDSPLYIMVEDKLDELDTKKDKLQKKVTEKKEKLELKEEKFEELKEKYYSIDKINQELLKLQEEQEYLLKDLEDKVKNAVTVTEKVKVEIEFMDQSTRRFLRRLTRMMMRPGVRGAKGLAAATALHMQLMRNIVNPKTVTKKYKEITVKDYSDSIKSNIDIMEDAEKLLKKADKVIDKMIKEIMEEYQDYLYVLPECSELLSNLEKVKRDLQEKEYEIDKIKDQQINLLEKNNAKVLTRT